MLDVTEFINKGIKTDTLRCNLKYKGVFLLTRKHPTIGACSHVFNDQIWLKVNTVKMHSYATGHGAWTNFSKKPNALALTWPSSPWTLQYASAWQTHYL